MDPASARLRWGPLIWLCGTPGQDRRQAAFPVALGTSWRRGRSPGLRLCCRRLLLPWQGSGCALFRGAQLSGPRLHCGEDEDQRCAACGGPAKDRGCVGGDKERGTVSSRRQRSVRPGNGHRLRQGAAAVRTVLVRGGRRSSRLQPAGCCERVLPWPDGDR